MSTGRARRSLTLAVRDHLKTALSLPSSWCEVMLDGRPPPACGDWFYAVHPGTRTNKLLTGDESYFGCNVTISGRSHTPFDRVGTDQVELVEGMDDRADEVWETLFTNQWASGSSGGVMNRANAYLTDGYPWTEALYPANMGIATPVRAEWFCAEEQQQHKTGGAWSGKPMPFCGLTIVISLQGALRIQELGDATA